ncbi:hypothetical protein N4P33_08385 [Streptomyces sp. 15-116A]|uniref:hypothetical protein n=1 Tax=Streptomyces sp. 15-116A TaxID=2259035 RepID=UPI0021B17634|nr:hypothetical protein [Streptomyces sp. 15-116A]MCT7352191.1 hypothetical protein [Streptomyces sp. 15-116A]
MTGIDEAGGAPERCGPLAELRLARMALAVCEDLALAGMPAAYAGSSFDGLSRAVSGAVVFHAPYNDESAGVYVKWEPHPMLVGQILRPEASDTRALAVGSAAAEAMRQALCKVLGAAGWAAWEYTNSVTGELYLKVGEKAPGE